MKIGDLHESAPICGGMNRGLVDDIGDVGAREARSHLGEALDECRRAILELDLFQVEFEEFLTLDERRQIDADVAIEAAASCERLKC